MSDLPVWQLNACQYQAGKGVYQPWIGEISGYQYSRFSKRQAAKYDEKRAAEWDASAQCKEAYAKEVIDAYEAGAFDWKSPRVSEDAQHVILHYQREKKAAAEKARLDEAVKANQILSLDAVQVGDTVFHIAYGYVRVVKKARLSLRGESLSEMAHLKGKQLLCHLGAIQWKSYNDVESSVKEEKCPT